MLFENICCQLHNLQILEVIDYIFLLDLFFLFLKNRHPDKWKDKIELKEDINLNVFPPKEELDAIYDRALEEARKRNEMLIGRRERIGIIIDHDSGLIDD